MNFSVVLLPSVIMHEWSHVAMCHIRKSHIVEVCYFKSITDMSGFVKHVSPSHFHDSLLIGCAPLILLTPIAFILFAISHIVATISLILSIPLFWLSFNIAIGAIPSGGDMNTVYNAYSRHISKHKNISVCLPFIELLNIMLIFSRLNLNIIFAYVIFISSLYITNYIAL